MTQYTHSLKSHILSNCFLAVVISSHIAAMLMTLNSTIFYPLLVYEQILACLASILIGVAQHLKLTYKQNKLLFSSEHSLSCQSLMISLDKSEISPRFTVYTLGKSMDNHILHNMLIPEFPLQHEEVLFIFIHTDYSSSWGV